jgi:hypothetical protein
MVAAITIDLGAIAEQILQGIREQTEEAFGRIVQYTYSRDERFMHWEMTERVMLGFDLVPAQMIEVSASIIRVPGGINQGLWRYDGKRAYYVVLGQRNVHFPDACLARVANGGGLRPVYSGEFIEVLPDASHKFDVAEGGSLFLLALRDR